MDYIDKIYCDDGSETREMRKINLLVDEVNDLKREIRELKNVRESQRYIQRRQDACR